MNDPKITDSQHEISLKCQYLVSVNSFGHALRLVGSSTEVTWELTSICTISENCVKSDFLTTLSLKFSISKIYFIFELKLQISSLKLLGFRFVPLCNASKMKYMK